MTRPPDKPTVADWLISLVVIIIVIAIISLYCLDCAPPLRAAIHRGSALPPARTLPMFTPAAMDAAAKEDGAGSVAVPRQVSPARVFSKRMTVTAYCPCGKCCGRFADGITASGRSVTANNGRFCAAGRSIPFGTLINIPGYGKVPVLDRGGAIRGDKLDVYFPTHQAALEWGRKVLDVEIGDRP